MTKPKPKSRPASPRFRILLIGAGVTGSRVLKQLRKKRGLDILTADPRPEPAAVKNGLIKAVDIKETLTPLTLQHVIRKAKPDLVLLAMSPEDMGLGNVAGVDILADELQKELAALAHVPVIEVSRKHA